MKKIAWMTLPLLMVAALVLSSCQAATVEEEKETETVAGKVTEKEAAKVEEEEEEEEVAAEAGPEMARDIRGNLVEKPRYGGTVTVSTGANPTTQWDPWWTQQGGADYLALAAVYDRLTGYDWSSPPGSRPTGIAFIPNETVKGYSAESWTNPDPLTYIITLRKGQYFWNKPPVNGRELIADDWKYSIERTMGLGEFEELGLSPYVGYTAWEVVESVEVIDKYTFAIHLKEPSAMFPEFWGAEIGPWVHPREVVDEYGDEFDWEYTVGSGPWVLDDLILDSSITYSKNERYYGIDDNFPENNIPYADGMKVLIIPDWSTRKAAMATGKVDVLGMGWEDAETFMETNPELQFSENPSVALGFAVNVSIEPYSDVRVRRAMQMAINLPEIAETYYGGTANPYPFMINPAFEQYVTPFEDLPAECQEAFTYDPEKAKALLAEAGYPNGFQQMCPITGAWELGELLAAYLEAIGIETEFRLMETASYNSLVYGTTADRTLAYWWCGAAQWHPVQILSYVTGGQETHYWNLADADDPYMNDRRDLILNTYDAVERDTAYKEAFLYGTCQHYQICAPGMVGYTMWQPWVKGYWGQERVIGIGMAPTWARVWIDTDLKFERTGVRD